MTSNEQQMKQPRQFEIAGDSVVIKVDDTMAIEDIFHKDQGRFCSLFRNTYFDDSLGPVNAITVDIEDGIVAQDARRISTKIELAQKFHHPPNLLITSIISRLNKDESRTKAWAGELTSSDEWSMQAVDYDGSEIYIGIDNRENSRCVNVWAEAYPYSSDEDTADIQRKLQAFYVTTAAALDVLQIRSSADINRPQQTIQLSTATLLNETSPPPPAMVDPGKFGGSVLRQTFALTTGGSNPEAGVEVYQPKRDPFEKIAGHEQPIAHLREIAAYFDDPERAASFGVTPQHFFLHSSDDGTGKRMLIDAFAEAVGGETIKATPASIYGQYNSESSAKLTQAFDRAINDANLSGKPQILSFENIGMLFSRRKYPLYDGPLLNDTFVHQVERLKDPERGHPLVIVTGYTTEDLGDMPQAITGSTGVLRPIEVEAPSTKTELEKVWAAIIFNREEARVEAAKSRGEQPRPLFDYGNLDFNLLAHRSGSLTPSQIAHIVEKEVYQAFVTNRETLIGRDDLMRAVIDFNQSVIKNKL